MLEGVFYFGSLEIKLKLVRLPNMDSPESIKSFFCGNFNMFILKKMLLSLRIMQLYLKAREFEMLMTVRLYVI